MNWNDVKVCGIRLADVRFGSWLRKNAVDRRSPVHDPPVEDARRGLGEVRYPQGAMAYRVVLWNCGDRPTLITEDSPWCPGTPLTLEGLSVSQHPIDLERLLCAATD
ncbi:hypothetical protein [Bradyrhizobium sp. Ec3.3]|uniref:hypothetical protein n=1 Tax=Bradyrhizobium sp. Ec3.3 TaxID=189753 RepID=UPI0012EB6B95|nr:hypothetical protein [Bradyrhizobium sp. Ec3.3]